MRSAARFRARSRADAAATAAAADQLAGLDDGSDDDPLMPLKLTWGNFRSTVEATAVEARVRGRLLVRRVLRRPSPGT